MNALEFRVNYVKVAEGRPVASATKMWPNKSSFWQHMTDANIEGDYGERCVNERQPFVKGDTLVWQILRDNWKTVRDKMHFSIIYFHIAHTLSTGIKISDLE